MTEDALSEKIRELFEKNPVFNANHMAVEIAALAIEHFRTIHSKALACHCECLGMNAENCIAACNNSQPPYKDADYFATVEKWGLTDAKGEPKI